MLVRISLASLRNGAWYEYVVRFALGGAATVVAGIVSSEFGASVGGLFLALPAIFCASATLIEKHEERRKRHEGLNGRRRGQQAAALDAAGAALGGLGLATFALIFALTVQRSVAAAFLAALAGFAVVSVTAWWLHRTLRVARRPRTRPSRSQRENVSQPSS